MSLTNAQVRFEAAVNGVRARGVHLALNVMTCCRSCTTFSDLGLPSAEARTEQPHAWHFGGQGQQLVWRNGQPLYRNGRAEGEAYEIFFGHGGPDLVAAQTLTEVFRGEGFEVEWTGDDAHAVIVHLS
jgi:hypothetical protein